MKRVTSLILGVALVVATLGHGFASPDVVRVRGIVGNVDLDQKTFNLKAEQRSWDVVFTDETLFVKEGERAEASDLKNETPAIVSGKISEDKKTINARVVAWGNLPDRRGPAPGHGGPPMVLGIMEKLDLEEGVFELRFKDPEGNERVLQVNYIERTRFLRDMKPSNPEAFSNGEEVRVVGPINPEEMKMEAHLVAFGKFERPGAPGQPGRGSPPVPVDGIPGLVTAIDHDEMHFSLQINEEITLTINYFEWTGFIRGNRFVFAEELEENTRIIFYGPVNREEKTARAHYVVWR